MSILTSLQPVAIPSEDEALRIEVREFLGQWVVHQPSHRRARSWSGYDPEFSRELGRKGWLGITLPIELGGGGRAHGAAEEALLGELGEGRVRGLVLEVEDLPRPAGDLLLGEAPEGLLQLDVVLADADGHGWLLPDF